MGDSKKWGAEEAQADQHCIDAVNFHDSTKELIQALIDLDQLLRNIRLTSQEYQDLRAAFNQMCHVAGRIAGTSGTRISSLIGRGEMRVRAPTL